MTLMFAMPGARAGARRPLTYREALMIVCVCRNVSDRTVRELASAGASLAEVIERTGAGTGCGHCRLDIARIHAAARAAAAPAAPSTREAA